MADEQDIRLHSSDDVDDGDDLETAYRRALAALDAAEEQVGSAFDAIAEPDDNSEGPDEDAGIGVALSIGDEALNEAAAGESAEADETAAEPVDEMRTVNLAQVVEALLFVGGEPLTSRRINETLGSESGATRITRTIESLNRRYRDENRPYEIRLVEGGYVLLLKPEFAELQRSVYGMGPREVRLSQDALEMLSFVAYRQPVTKAEVNATDKKNAMSILRQLIRRKLVSVERGKTAKDTQYSTTARFLDVFGLTSIEELPHAEDLEFK